MRKIKDIRRTTQIIFCEKKVKEGNFHTTSIHH